MVDSGGAIIGGGQSQRNLSKAPPATPGSRGGAPPANATPCAAASGATAAVTRHGVSVKGGNSCRVALMGRGEYPPTLGANSNGAQQEENRKHQSGGKGQQGIVIMQEEEEEEEEEMEEEMGGSIPTFDLLFGLPMHDDTPVPRTTLEERDENEGGGNGEDPGKKEEGDKATVEQTKRQRDQSAIKDTFQANSQLRPPRAPRFSTPAGGKRGREGRGEKEEGGEEEEVHRRGTAIRRPLQRFPPPPPPEDAAAQRFIGGPAKVVERGDGMGGKDISSLPFPAGAGGGNPQSPSLRLLPALRDQDAAPGVGRLVDIFQGLSQAFPGKAGSASGPLQLAVAMPPPSPPSAPPAGADAPCSSMAQAKTSGFQKSNDLLGASVGASLSSLSGRGSGGGGASRHHLLLCMQDDEDIQLED